MSSSEIKPPSVAQMLFSLLALPGDRSALMGDLLEEYTDQYQSSPDEARRWYWRQVLMSLPHLINQRLKSEPAQQIALIIVAGVAAILLVSFWDVYVARFSARSFAAVSKETPLLMVRTVYFLVQLTGVALAGVLVALVTFKKNSSLSQNMLHRALPVILILITPSLVTMLASGDDYPVLYGILRLGLTVPALLAGAAMGAWVFIYHQKK